MECIFIFYIRLIQVWLVPWKLDFDYPRSFKVRKIWLFFFMLLKALMCLRATLVAQLVKNLPAGQETWVRSLGQEDPLQKEMATHSIILAWRSLWTGEPGGLWFMESQSQTNWVTKLPPQPCLWIKCEPFSKGNRIFPSTYPKIMWFCLVWILIELYVKET